MKLEDVLPLVRECCLEEFIAITAHSGTLNHRIRMTEHRPQDVKLTWCAMNLGGPPAEPRKLVLEVVLEVTTVSVPMVDSTGGARMALVPKYDDLMSGDGCFAT